MTVFGKGQFIGVIGAMLIAMNLCAPNLATAQLATAGSAPTNLSASGSASLPTIGVGPNGALHSLWWDQIDGTRYARGIISDTATVWNKSVAVQAIVGQRKTDANTKITTIAPPARLQMLVDRVGVAHATWFDVDEQLMYAQLAGTANAAWSAPTVLSPKAIAIAMTLDMSGTLQMAYAQTTSTPQSPSGMYYLSRAGGTFKRALVYASTYFRTAKPDDISLSLAKDVKGNVVVAWHAAREEQSVQVLSTDGGNKWQAPQPIAPRNQLFGLPVKVSVAATGPGQFLMLWRDAGASGCGLTQKRTDDAGATWSVPERVLTTLVRCPGIWALVNSENGALTLVGRPSVVTVAADSAGTLAAWDGTAWGVPVDVSVAYKDPVTGNTRTLGCINMALSNGNLAAIGCDARNDVWGKGQRFQAASLIQSSKSAWSKQNRLAGVAANGASVNGATNAVTLAADQKSSVVYAVWSQAATTGEIGTSLNISVYHDGQWGDPTTLIQIKKDTSLSETVVLAQTDQPSLTVDREGKLHLAWSGGSSGRVFYMNAFARDASIAGNWSSPVALPAPTLTGSDPNVVTDPNSSTVFVLYAVPFNEKRGVYLTRSDDGGTTWSTQTLVFDAQAASWDAVDSLQLTIDASSETLHATWMKSQLPGATGAKALYYARSADRGRTWSAPKVVAEGDIGGPRLTVSAPNNLMLTWTHKNQGVSTAQAPLQVWWQASSDGGQGWTSPSALTGFEAVSGNIGVTADGRGNVNLAALGLGTSDETTLLYARFAGTTWTDPDKTSLGEPSALGNSVDLVVDGMASQIIAALRTAVLQPDGSRVFAPIGLSRAAVNTDTNTNTTVVATPVPLPTFVPSPTVGRPTPTPAPTATPLPTVNASDLNTTQAKSGSQNTLLISGLIAAAVVIVGSILVSVLRRRR